MPSYFRPHSRINHLLTPISTIASHIDPIIPLFWLYCRSLNFSKDIFPPLHLKTSLLITSIHSFPMATSSARNRSVTTHSGLGSSSVTANKPITISSTSAANNSGAPLALKTRQLEEISDWDSDSDADIAPKKPTKKDKSSASPFAGKLGGLKMHSKITSAAAPSSSLFKGSTSTASHDQDDDDDWGDMALSTSTNKDIRSTDDGDDESSSDDDWAKDFGDEDDKPSGTGGNSGISLGGGVGGGSGSGNGDSGSTPTLAASTGPAKPLLKMQLLLSENLESSVDEVAAYKLIPERGDVNIVKVIYPKPSILYSIKTTTGHNQLSETELDAWLTNLIIKCRDEVLSHKEAKIKLLKEREEAANTAAAAAAAAAVLAATSSSKSKSDRKKATASSATLRSAIHAHTVPAAPSRSLPPYHTMTPMSRDWCNELLSYAHKLAAFDSIDECWSVVSHFFSQAKQYLATHKYLKGSRLIIASNLAFIASRIWRPNMDHEFKFILSVVGKLAPLYTLTSNIMLVETLAHHSLPNRSVWTQLTNAYEDAEAELKKLDASEANLKGASADSPTPPSSAQSTNLSGSANVEKDANLSEGDVSDSVASSHSSKAANDRDRKLKTIQRSRLHCKTMQARILADVNLFFLDRSMLTTRVQQISAEEDEADDGAGDTYLCDDEERIKRLHQLYPGLENGWDKAKAALALGLSYTISQDYDLAERLLFECVYMLDTLPAAVTGMRPLISELGSSALTAFGQVLADNYKYKYSVPAIDGALLLSDMRGREDDYYALLRTAAKLAQTAGDLPRAIDLYSEIVEHYRQSQRINEAVYVNELLCTMHIENGSFQQAINCLQRASESLPDYSRFFDETAPKNSSFDPGFLRLQLQTAKTLLTSYHWDKAYDLLEQMTRYRQPVPLMLATYELLARAFLKKRSFSEADSWIDTWREFQKSQSTLDGRLLSRRYSVSNHNANMTYDVAYYAMKAKNCFFANKLMEALEFIDKAILFSSASRLASLGKFYYLRGRILRRMCRVSFSLQFPTTLKPRSSHAQAAYAAASSANASSGGAGGGSGGSGVGGGGNGGSSGLSSSMTIASVQLPSGSGGNGGSGSGSGTGSPTTLTSMPLSPRNIMDAVDTPTHIFDRPSDLLQECIASYRQAYNYFKLTGDDCKIAKALSDMAEGYLEFLFWPVASSESTVDDISTFPLFKVSMIALNAREEQRQNVINLDRKREQQNMEKAAAQQAANSNAASLTSSAVTDVSSSSSIPSQHANRAPLIHADSTESAGSSTSASNAKHGGNVGAGGKVGGDMTGGTGKKEGPGSVKLVLTQSHGNAANNVLNTPSGSQPNSGHKQTSPGTPTGTGNATPSNTTPRTPTSANHKRSQSAMANIVPIEHSHGGSPRDRSPEGGKTLHNATQVSASSSAVGAHSSPSSGKLKHRSDRLKKKHSHTKVTMLMKESSVSSQTSAVSSDGATGGGKSTNSKLKDSGARKRADGDESTDESWGAVDSSGSGYNGGASSSSVPPPHPHAHPHSASGSFGGGGGSGGSGTPGSPVAPPAPQNFVISLKTVENAAKLSLEIAAYTGNILLALNGYLNMAELRFLEGKTDAANTFFVECTEQLSSYFLNGTKFVLNEAPPSFLTRMFALVKRIVRFLFCLPKATINRNLFLVDLYLGLENDLEQQLKKAVGSQVFGTYMGSDASLPRSLFSLKLQKKYRSERTTSFSQLTQVSNPSINSSAAGSANSSSSTLSRDSAASNNASPMGHASGLNAGNAAPQNMSAMGGSSTLGRPGKLSGASSASGTPVSAATTSSAAMGAALNPSSSAHEEHAIAKNNASLIWGYYFYLRQQQKRYGEGKLTREELKTRYTKSLKLMLRLATVARSQEAEYIREWNKRMTTVLTRKASRMMVMPTPLRKNIAAGGNVPTVASLLAAATSVDGLSLNVGSMKLSASNLGATPTTSSGLGSERPDRERSDSTSNNLASPVKNPSYEEIVSNRNEKLSKLVYILQLDDRLVQYVPSTGRRCVQLIGKREQLANSTSPRNVPPHVFMKIHLLDMKEESVTIVVPSDFSLNDVIFYLLQRNRWEEECHPASADLMQRELDGTNSQNTSDRKHVKNFFTSFLTSLPLISMSSSSSSSTANYFPNDRIEKVSQSMNFYDEFAHLLSLIGEDTTTATPLSGSNPALNLPAGGASAEAPGSLSSSTSSIIPSESSHHSPRGSDADIGSNTKGRSGTIGGPLQSTSGKNSPVIVRPSRSGSVSDQSRAGHLKPITEDSSFSDSDDRGSKKISSAFSTPSKSRVKQTAAGAGGVHTPPVSRHVNAVPPLSAEKIKTNTAGSSSAPSSAKLGRHASPLKLHLPSASGSTQSGDEDANSAPNPAIHDSSSSSIHVPPPQHSASTSAVIPAGGTGSSATPRSAQQTPRAPATLVLPSSSRHNSSIPSSLITLAKKKESLGGQTMQRPVAETLTGNLIPLRSKLHKRVYESFTNQELSSNTILRPLEVFLYMNTAKVARAGSAFNASFANSIHFSDELAAYLHSLAGKILKDAVVGPSTVSSASSLATTGSSSSNNSSSNIIGSSEAGGSGMGGSSSNLQSTSSSSIGAGGGSGTHSAGGSPGQAPPAMNPTAHVHSVDPSKLIDKKSGKSLAPILFELSQLFSPLIEILPLGGANQRPNNGAAGPGGSAPERGPSGNPSSPRVGVAGIGQHSLLTMDAKVYWKSFTGELSGEERMTKIAARAPDAVLNDMGSGGIVSRTPLSIICSKYMHAIPWELFLPTDTILRYFALEDAAGRPTRLAMKHSTSRKLRKKVTFSMVQCFYSQSFRNIQQQEAVRKSWVLQNVNNSLNLTTERYVADYNGDNSPIFPFHTPLISHPKRITHYRSKYKHIQFVDLWSFVMDPAGILTTLDGMETPILLLSYSDLLEMSSTLLTLSRAKKTPTFVFIPESHIKEFCAKLGKRQALALKTEFANTEDAYQFLMNLVLAVSKELAVPVAVFHPPAL